MGARKALSMLALDRLSKLQTDAPLPVPGTYCMFGQASRLNFRMEQYGNGRYVIDSACRARAVAVEKSCVRLLVFSKLSVEVDNSIRLITYETYRRQ